MCRISLTVIFFTIFGYASASIDQCRGTCPEINPNNDVYLLAHEDCGKYCSCVYGKPFEMLCPPGLHYSEKDRVCTIPILAECIRPSKFFSKQAFTLLDSELDRFQEQDENLDECIGVCPDELSEYYGISVTLEHEKCHKFCKCMNGKTSVQTCPKNLHFNLEFGGCTIPTEANCQGIIDNEYSTIWDSSCPCAISTPTPTLEPQDPLGCIGTCPAWGSDKVIYLTHKDCSQFCKCHFGILNVMSCSDGMHFNPTLQKCEDPSQAGCADNSTLSQGQTTTHKPTSNPPSGSHTTPTPGSTSSPGDPSGCIGTCPAWESDNVVHLPHRDCTQFCKCDFEVPHVMTCPSGLHFNPKLQVCDRPSQAGCSDDSTPSQGQTITHKPTPNQPSGSHSTPTPGSTSSPGDPSGCIGTCPAWESDNVVHLPHRDCTQFCKCDFEVPHVMTCPSGLHFNPKLQVCDRPSQAGCAGDSTPSQNQTTIHKPTSNPPSGSHTTPTPGSTSSPGDPSGCIGTCPVWESDNVIYLPHRECTRYCKCDHEVPHVMTCPSGLHFNPTLQKCEDPSQAGCAGDSTPSQSQTTTHKPTPHPPSGSHPTPAQGSTSSPGDPSGCIGTCPVWESDNVVHLPHRDCTRFCKCDFTIPHVMTCPSGLHFNPKLQVCDRPSQAGCAGDSTPSQNQTTIHKPTSNPPSGSHSTPTQGSTSSPEDPSECIGTCPVWETDNVVHLPHRDCTRYCKCDHEVPHVMTCPSGLHFNPTLQKCEDPSQAGCAGDSTPSQGQTVTHKPTPNPPSGSHPTPTQGSTSSPGDPSGCIGTCPVWETDNVVHLPHRDCTRFCKCDFTIPHVMTCPSGLHFNPKLQVCDRPSQAGCAGDSTPSQNQTTIHKPTSNPPSGSHPTPAQGSTSSPGDPSGCIGTCPAWESDNVVHLPHRDCTRFCKCDFTIPHVMTCPSGLHFNPTLQVCDRPSQAGCAESSGSPERQNTEDISQKYAINFNRLFRW